MKCCPGDMALVIRSRHLSNLGKVVEVLHAAPIGVIFKLPDGTMHTSTKAHRWVVGSFGSVFDVNTTEFKEIQRMFAVYNDRDLQPLRGLEHKQKSTITVTKRPKVFLL